MGPKWLVILVLGALLAAGCKVDTSATITLDKSGGGSVAVRVHLDRSAVQLVERGGGKLESRIVLSDLRGSGWKLAPWQRAPDGGATIRLVHVFGNGTELQRVVASISGTKGLLRDAHVTRSRNLVQDRDGVSVVADLSALKSGVRDDQQLASRLQAAGVNVAQVDFVLGAQLKKAFTLAVTLAVPPNKTQTFSIAAGQRDTVNLSSSKVHWNRFIVLMIGFMLVFLALLLYLSASISARRRRTRELQFAAARSRSGSYPVM
ncbi:MAG: hypothetical protein JWL83_4630 [Actinomycetia bacterium]|nr:hypothetical protein [Actinomycetes bacterium]